MILDFVRLEIMILDFVGGSKSGVPDGEQDKVFGAHFEDLGAKPFESLAARNPKMEMFNFPCSVGVNNLECKTWEEEQDVLPGSHVSSGIVDIPTKRRRGGVGMGPHYKHVGPKSRRFQQASTETTCRVKHAHFGSRIVPYSFVACLVDC